MNDEHSRIHEGIRDFCLDEPGAGFTFSQRLARENCWSSEYTRRVIVAFLAVVAGHPVTPSDQVPGQKGATP